MASPTDITVFGGYFPFASRYSLDVPVLFNQYGLAEIWDEEWAQVENAAVAFWDEIAAESPTKAKVVEILRKYNDDMQKAGRPHRYS